MTLMYAELLANIRQISVIANLPTPSDLSTRVELSKNGQQISLLHQDVLTVLNLPGQAMPDVWLSRPILGLQELSWRLPVAGQLTRADFESNDSAWPAASMGENVEFLCRGCSEPVVKKGAIQSWKDLPSENWAEMMEFWHCHKPSSRGSSDEAGHRDTEDSSLSKGYGANTKMTAHGEVGFVDITTLLFTTSDCSGVESENTLQDSSQPHLLVCSKCRFYIGHNDPHAGGYRLYKWRLKTSNHEPSMASIITAQFQSIMSAQCSSRLLLVSTDWRQSSPKSEIIISEEHCSVAPGPETTKSEPIFLSLWVLSPSIRYSATEKGPSAKQTFTSDGQAQDGKLAMKVFWQEVSGQHVESLAGANGVEELVLPHEALSEIRNILQRTNLYLPPSGRTFQHWDVGLLERLEKGT